MIALRSLSRACLALALPLATANAQQTHIVQGGGPAFQIAVQQATPGDILLVRAGSYDMVAIDKGLTVRCDPGVSIMASSRSAALAVDVPAGQLLTWTGGSVLGLPSLFTAFFVNGAGIAMFTDLGVAGLTSLQGRQVGLNRCGLGAVVVGGVFPGTSAVLTDCTMNSKMIVRGGRATMAGGAITISPNFLFGSPAVEMSGNSELVLSGDARLTAFWVAGAPLPAVQATGGRVLYAPSVQFTHGTPQPVVGASQTIQRWLPAVSSITAAAGQTFQATTFAEPGSSTHLLLNLPSPRIPLPFGDLWIGQGSLLLDSGIVPATGERSASVPLPLTLPRHLPVVIQSITTLTNGELWIGPPTVDVLH